MPAPATVSHPSPLEAEDGDELVDCAYCYALCQQHPAVPQDDEEWEREATQHYDDCEWVLTRAHTLVGEDA